MKLLLLVAAVLTLPLVGRAEENAAWPTHDAMVRKIREAFPYVAPVGQREEEKKELDSQVVTLERVTVVRSKPLRDLREKIDAADEKAKAEKFSVITGGTILKKDIGKARIEIGTWGSSPGVNILKISW